MRRSLYLIDLVVYCVFESVEICSSVGIHRGRKTDEWIQDAETRTENKWINLHVSGRAIATAHGS